MIETPRAARHRIQLRLVVAMAVLLLALGCGLLTLFIQSVQGFQCRRAHPTWTVRMCDEAVEGGVYW